MGVPDAKIRHTRCGNDGIRRLAGRDCIVIISENNFAHWHVQRLVSARKLIAQVDANQPAPNDDAHGAGIDC